MDWVVVMLLGGIVREAMQTLTVSRMIPPVRRIRNIALRGKVALISGLSLTVAWNTIRLSFGVYHVRFPSGILPMLIILRRRVGLLYIWFMYRLRWNLFLFLIPNLTRSLTVVRSWISVLSAA